MNGDMSINQRVFTSTAQFNTYNFDRWRFAYNAVQTLTSSAATDVPSGEGFSNSLKITTTSTGFPTVTTGFISQRLEGNSISQLAWGTATPKPVTLSFWVKSSMTGTWGVTFLNGYWDRIYTTTYTINSANTWEKKTITIPGDSTGTWLSDTSLGLELRFWIDAASGDEGANNTWRGTGGLAATGQASLGTTLNATFLLTGVQLEAGTYATAFEKRPIGVELALCQRYYEKSYELATAPGTATDSGFILAMTGGSQAGSSGIHDAYIFFKVTKRSNPTVTVYDNAGNINKCRRTAVGVANYDNQDVRDVNAFTNGVYFRSASGSGTTNTVSCHFTASAEV